MSQRTIRFKDDVEAQIEQRAKSEGRSFAGWVKRAVEKALGSEAAVDTSSPKSREAGLSPAPPRRSVQRKTMTKANRKTPGQRTPPRPQLPDVDAMIDSDEPKTIIDPGKLPSPEEILADMQTLDESSGCPECGGEYVAHPEFGRFCTGCGARVR